MTNIFELQKVDAAYINSLVALVEACRAQHVNINEVRFFQNGWHVTFENYDGDAVCHDGSYDSPCRFGVHNNDWSSVGSWETMGFPWDYHDVSVHDAGELAFYLRCLNEGLAPWEKDCGWDEDLDGENLYD